MRVYILLFNARKENEGVHTIKIGDRNKVLMFKEEDDATRFALMLEAQDFPTATVEEFDSEEIEEFCRSADYDCELVTSEMLAVPPEKNLDETDWNEDRPPTSATGTADSAEEPETSMASDELERIRRQLEGLL